MIIRQVEFLPMLLRSCGQKLLLHVNDNYKINIKRADKFFRWRKSSLANCSVFGSSHIGLLIQKIKESGSGFQVLANKTS